MTDAILALNCGSSSIKFGLFDASPPADRKAMARGAVNGIGTKQATYVESGEESTALILDPDCPYHDALTHLRRRVDVLLGDRRLVAMAHRVVHGGSAYREPVRITDAVLADLRSLIPLAPLHQPFALDAIVVFLTDAPDLDHVACFDTAFHRTLPLVEQLLPLNWKAWESGLKRYGFHGLSYEYQALALRERHGGRAQGKTLVAHMGSGASLCAMDNLSSVATTMGFSALDGLMMGTRCGSIDPGVVLHLLETESGSAEELGQTLYHASGLLGVSGVSADPRILLQHERDQGVAGARVRAALALYVRRIVREVGALVAVLGGLDLLAFTAGIGEHNAAIRARACDALSYLGVAIDGTANARHHPVISTAASRVLVAVEPADEEWMACMQATRLRGA